jgi:hypothetical protein
LIEDLFRVGEAVLLVLREDQLAVGEHVELADRARDDLGVEALLLLDFGRETRGAGLVVSGLAVLDDDVHEVTMPTRLEDGKARLAPGGRAP